MKRPRGLHRRDSEQGCVCVADIISMKSQKVFACVSYHKLIIGFLDLHPKRYINTYIALV